MNKTLKELKQMSIKDQEDYFNTLPYQELKKYYGRKLKGDTYNIMNAVYVKKREELYNNLMGFQ